LALSAAGFAHVPHMPLHQITRVAVVGSGKVGSTFAYTLLLSGLASEIVLVDADARRAEGEAMDLNHAVPFTTPARITPGSLEDVADSAVVVMAAGVGQQPGETRLDLLRRNVAVFRELVPRIAEINPHGILLVATNPVDVLSYVSWKLSGLASERVIGSGTILDTARFRYLLSQHFGVDPRSLHAYIVGEHGDSEVPVWSLANISGMRLRDYCAAHDCQFDEQQMAAIFEQTRTAAYHIIERKGATHYAVAAGLLRIVEAIVRDQRTVLSVSSLINGVYGIDDVYLSLPTVVAGGGAEKILRLPLSDEEVAAVRRSAQVMIDALRQIGLRA
jgi:L-lactate dehydrogenase